MKSDRIHVLQAGVDPVTRKEALENIRLFLCSDRGHQVVTLNSEMVVLATNDADFRRIVDEADLVVADGMGVLCAASYLGKKRQESLVDFVRLLLMPFYQIFAPRRITDALPEKISGIDLVHAICASDFMQGKRIYLLGAEEGIAAKAGAVLQKRYPHLGLAGAEAGIGRDFSARHDDELIARVNAQTPDVIFVALGAPRQEKWIAENLEKLPSVRVAIGVGGSFDVLAGKVQRAPQLMQSHGLEWLWRLVHQPRRIKRIYNATCKLAWLIFRSEKDKMRR